MRRWSIALVVALLAVSVSPASALHTPEVAVAQANVETLGAPSGGSVVGNSYEVIYVGALSERFGVLRDVWTFYEDGRFGCPTLEKRAFSVWSGTTYSVTDAGFSVPGNHTYWLEGRALGTDAEYISVLNWYIWFPFGYAVGRRLDPDTSAFSGSGSEPGLDCPSSSAPGSGCTERQVSSEDAIALIEEMIEEAPGGAPSNLMTAIEMLRSGLSQWEEGGLQGKGRAVEE